ncbi:MAG TPA: phosphate/phosphite/phosphonate ABC transporter substrate-binding protein [Mucilaginibacter sp.]|jgi:phosphonate transport system substrate-binding protein
MRTFIKIFILITVLALAGCKNKGSVDSNGMPKTLVIGYVQTESLDEIKRVRESVRNYLEKKLGIPVEIIFSTDYAGVIEALKSNKVHMASLPPFAYVIATRTMNLTPIVTLGNNGKPSTYQSVIIVNGHSNLKSMADVKAHAKNLSFCFVDPASTSGHLVPRGYLNSIGLDPNSAFKQTVFAGSHMTSVLSVKSGKIDVGCTTNMIFGLMTRKNMIKNGDLRVVWTSDPIVSDPVVVRGDVNKELTKKIQQAYLDMNKEAPEILSSYLKLFLRDTAKRSYMMVQDSMYNRLRKIAAGIKDLKAN